MSVFSEKRAYGPFLTNYNEQKKDHTQFFEIFSSLIQEHCRSAFRVDLLNLINHVIYIFESKLLMYR